MEKELCSFLSLTTKIPNYFQKKAETGQKSMGISSVHRFCTIRLKALNCQFTPFKLSV